MGNLMRRNILTYKAPEYNEGYDLICINPDPRYKRKRGQLSQIRVQVKSRYATDCDRGFPVKEHSIDAFDFLIIVFMNIGNYKGELDGSDGRAKPEYFTLSQQFIRDHHNKRSSWQKVLLRGLDKELKPYADEDGFELIAKALGVKKPTREQ